MSFLVAAGDQSTLTNAKAACDVDGAICFLAPSPSVVLKSIFAFFAAKDSFDVMCQCGLLKYHDPKAKKNLKKNTVYKKYKKYKKGGDWSLFLS